MVKGDARHLPFLNPPSLIAASIGMDPMLAIAANSSGGVTGKMISPQSIAVACAAVGLAGKESHLFRFTIKHSLFLLLVAGLITFLQHNFPQRMIPQSLSLV
ncbi:hypothetical protein AS29_009375 [Bacillus sp. SJS]|nr:hypothetical protein AS29_009375 [Bacillus sp. SJS]